MAPAEHIPDDDPVSRQIDFPRMYTGGREMLWEESLLETLAVRQFDFRATEAALHSSESENAPR